LLDPTIGEQYQTTLVAQCTITSYTNVSSYSLSKYFHPENVAYDLLRFPFDVRMHQSDIVVACNYIS